MVLTVRRNVLVIYPIHKDVIMLMETVYVNKDGKAKTVAKTLMNVVVILIFVQTTLNVKIISGVTLVNVMKVSLRRTTKVALVIII